MAMLLPGKPMRWKSFFKIIRPVNLVIMAVMLLLVRYAIFQPIFAQNNLTGLMPGWQFLLLVTATLCIGAGGYVINDVLDIEIDRINKPGKQVIGTKISEATGNRYHTYLTGTGVAAGIAFSYMAGNVYLSVLFVIIPTALYYYSYKYKYLPAAGNIVVALLAALVVMIYWLFEFYHLKSKPELFIDASRSFLQLNRFVLAFAFFAFMTTLIREMIKDAQDIEGDRRFGCRTIPVLAGIPATRYILVALEILTIAAVAWFQIHLFTCCRNMALFLIITQALMLYSIIRTLTASTRNDFSRLSFLYKIIMLAGMLSLIFMQMHNS